METVTHVACLALYWSAGESNFPYQILVSNDESKWSVAHTENNTDGDQDIVTLDSDTRYVKLTYKTPFYNPRSLSEIALLGKCPDSVTTPPVALRHKIQAIPAKDWRAYSPDGKLLWRGERPFDAAKLPARALFRRIQ